MELALWVATQFGLAILAIGVGLLLSSGHLTISRVRFRGSSPTMELRAAMWRGPATILLAALVAAALEPRLDWPVSETLAIMTVIAALAIIGFARSSQVWKVAKRNITKRWRLVPRLLLIAVPAFALVGLTLCGLLAPTEGWIARALAVMVLLAGVDVSIRLTAHSVIEGPAKLSLGIMTAVVVVIPAAATVLLTMERADLTVLVSTAAAVAISAAYIAERWSAQAGRISLLGAAMSMAAVAATLSMWTLPLFIVTFVVAFLPEKLIDSRWISYGPVAFRYAVIPTALVGTAAALELIDRMPEML